jgi:hypothetical protein
VLAADQQHVAAARQRAHVLGRRPQALDDAGERYDIDLAADPHVHAVQDGERERQRQREHRAVARRRLDGDAAAHASDVAAHDVHADAAAGDVGDLLGGGEPRGEDQVDHLALAQARALLGSEHFNARLPARLLLGKDKFATVKIVAALTL